MTTDANPETKPKDKPDCEHDNISSFRFCDSWDYFSLRYRQNPTGVCPNDCCHHCKKMMVWGKQLWGAGGGRIVRGGWSGRWVGFPWAVWQGVLEVVKMVGCPTEDRYVLYVVKVVYLYEVPRVDRGTKYRYLVKVVYYCYIHQVDRG